MPEKSTERRILQMVYDETKYAEVLESECPDFKLRMRGYKTFFGVEVTELYESQPQARLNKIPGYFTDIIQHDRFRHKDDIEALRPEEVTIHDKDGTFKSKTRALVHQPPDAKEQSRLLAEVIRAKQDKLPKYDPDLDHTNLIIFAPEAGFWYLEADLIYHHFYTPELKSALFASRFREIFFVVRIHEHREVYISLKMLLLLAEFRTFLDLVRDYPWESSDDAPPLLKGKGWSGKALATQLFAKYLRSKAELVYTRTKRRKIEVILGGCGVTLEDMIYIYDKADYPLELDAKPVTYDNAVTAFESDTFRAKADEIMKDRIFTSSAGIEDVKSALKLRRSDSKTVYARPVRD